tara:strand:- start:333 stop:914 length:582 start_codon:yes stop_codon:yes gene_type:complete
MVLPLIALAPYAPAAIAGIGAAAKGLSGGRGQRIVQGGINTIKNIGQSPWLTNLANRFNLGYAPDAVGKSGKFGNLFSQLATPGGMQSGNPMNIYGMENIGEIGKEIKNQEFLRTLDTDLNKGQIFEKVDELTKKIKDIFSEDEPKKKKKKEEPSLDLVPMKKGGHAKKQRKRKHYKSSGFVKMKKSKKRKYI